MTPARPNFFSIPAFFRAVPRAVMAVALVSGGGSFDASAVVWQPSNIQVVADPIADFIAEASRRFGIQEAWIRAVMQAESAGDARALSSKGAMGLMQIMPDTWADLRDRYNLGANPYDARDNILAGAAYLRELFDRYGSPGFLAAYNAGPARYEAHLHSGDPLPVETQNYLAILTPLIGRLARDGAMIAASPLPFRPDEAIFIAQPNDKSAAINGAFSSNRTALEPQSNGLFIAISNPSSQP